MQGVKDIEQLSASEMNMVMGINIGVRVKLMSSIKSNIDRGLPERTIELEGEVSEKEYLRLTKDIQFDDHS